MLNQGWFEAASTLSYDIKHFTTRYSAQTDYNPATNIGLFFPF